MRRPIYRFALRCVEATDGAEIQAMADTAKPITRRTFLTYIDRAELAQLERGLRYDTGHERGGLRMSRDWHVGYYRSTYQGRPCVYFDHSRIEHIFLEGGNR